MGLKHRFGLSLERVLRTTNKQGQQKFKSHRNGSPTASIALFFTQLSVSNSAYIEEIQDSEQCPIDPFPLR